MIWPLLSNLLQSPPIPPPFSPTSVNPTVSLNFPVFSQLLVPPVNTALVQPISLEKRFFFKRSGLFDGGKAVLQMSSVNNSH